MIHSVGDFIRYFEGVRRRTRSVIEQVSPELPQLYGYRMEDVLGRAERREGRL